MHIFVLSVCWLPFVVVGVVVFPAVVSIASNRADSSFHKIQRYSAAALPIYLVINTAYLFLELQRYATTTILYQYYYYSSSTLVFSHGIIQLL